MDISIILPCRNEERYIGGALESIVHQDYPKERIEVFVIDGMSTDKTREIIRDYSHRHAFINLIDNTKKTAPAALNIGINKSCGDIVMRMDVHAIYAKDYILKCLKYLREYDADNVGGVIETVPSKDTAIAGAIAVATSHPFGVGNAYFRIGTKEPRYVDTVPFGCYKKEVFRKIGIFDEDMIRNQDDEFNFRLISNSGKILLVPDIVSIYYARDTLSKLWNMYFQYGYFKPLVAHKLKAVLTWRQLIPSIFIISIIISGVLSFASQSFSWLFFLIISGYVLANIFFSFSIAMQKGFRHILVLPSVFCTIHLSYGWGYLKGFRDFIVLKKYIRKKIKDVPLTR